MNARTIVIGAFALLALAGGYLWATRGTVILLDLSWLNCF